MIFGKKRDELDLIKRGGGLFNQKAATNPLQVFLGRDRVAKPSPRGEHGMWGLGFLHPVLG